MRGKYSFLLMISVLLLTLVFAAPAMAAESREVATPEAFTEALLDSAVQRIILTGDIEVLESITMDVNRRNLTIDGKGYTLTLGTPLYFETVPKNLNVTVQDAVVYADQGMFSILDDIEKREDVEFTFSEVIYRGETMVSLMRGGKISIDGGDYTFSGDGSGPMAEAKMIEFSGQVQLSDAHGRYAAPMIKVAEKLAFLKDVEFTAAMPPESDALEIIEIMDMDGLGIAELDPDAVVSFGEIKSVSFQYNGGDICMHEHDDFCDADLETGECNHDCAGEQYECCRNPLFYVDVENPATFQAAGSYLGDYEISASFLDGINKQYDALKSIAPEKLKGAKSLLITYIPPETIDIKGKIHWDDEDNKFDTRPKSVRVKLFRNGMETDRLMTVSKQAFTFEDEDYQDEDSERYVYTIRQVDDLTPEYVTTHSDKSNTITNKLVTSCVKVHYLDARTEKKIADTKTIKVPKGYPLTVEAPDIDGYQLEEDAKEKYVYDSVKKDHEITFYYDEMIAFEGTFTFDNSVPEDRRKFPKAVLVYQGVWQTYKEEYLKNGGTDRTPEEVTAQIAIMPGYAMPVEHQVYEFEVKAKKFDTDCIFRKYDDEGEKNIYSFAPEEGDLSYEMSVDEEGKLHIIVFFGIHTEGEGAES